MSDGTAGAEPAGANSTSEARPISAAAVKSMLDDGDELAILDVRE
jgi:hypothetical protein